MSTSSGSQTYSLNNTTTTLTAEIAGNGAIDIMDGSTAVAQVTTTDGFTYAVTGIGESNTVNDTNSESGSASTLTFNATINGAGSTSVSLTVGDAFGQIPTDVPTGVTSKFVDASALSNVSLNIASLFPTATGSDWVWVQGNGSGNTITDGNTAAMVVVSYEATGATSLTETPSGASTWIVTDNTGATDFTVTNNGNSTFTVVDGQTHTTSTVVGVNDLHFFAGNGANPPTAVADLQVGLTWGPGGADQQGGNFYWVNDSSFGNSVDIAGLFGTALSGADNVWVNSGGGADTITNSTHAQMSVGFRSSDSGAALSEVAGATAGTVYLEDGTATDYTITAGSSADSFTVTDHLSGVSSTVSGASRLQFSTQGGGATWLQVGLQYGEAPAASGQTGNFYWVNDSSFGDSVDVAGLFGTALSGADNVWVSNGGGADTITNSTHAQMTVGFQVNDSIISETAGPSAGTVLVTDDAGTTDYTITAGTSGTYTVVDDLNSTTSTVSGASDLQFSAFLPGMSVNVPLAERNGSVPGFGNGGIIKLTPFNETVNASTDFPSATSSTDTVAFVAGGGNDTLTGHAGGPNWYIFATDNLPQASATGTTYQAGTDTITNFTAGTDVLALSAGATASISGNVVTLGGNLTGTITLSGLSSLAPSSIVTDLNGTLQGNDIVSAQGVGQVVTGGGGFLLDAQNQPGTMEMLVNGGGNDTMVGGKGGDAFAYTSVAPGETHTIVNFNEANGDAILLPVGATATLDTTSSPGNTIVGVSGGGSLNGTINVQGATIDSNALVTWVVGSTTGGDTLTTSGITPVGTGGFVLQSQNSTGTTTLDGGPGETLVHTAGAMGTTVFDFSAAGNGVADTVMGFNPTTGDSIHLPSGATYTHAASGANDVITANLSGGGTATITLMGMKDANFSSAWVK